MKARWMLFLVVIVAVLSSGPSVLAQGQKPWPEGRLDAVLQTIKESYLNVVDIAWCRQKIVEGGLNACVDPHSYYLAPLEAKVDSQLSTGVHGEISGVAGNGVVIHPETGVLAAAGFQKGDQLLEIDDHPILGLTPNEMLPFLRGAPGSQVRVKAIRGKMIFTKVVTLGRTVDPSIEWYMVDDIAYIWIKEFTEATSQEFSEAMDYAVHTSHAVGVAIDLRGNRGGSTFAAVRILKQFARKGDVIIKIVARDPVVNAALNHAEPLVAERDGLYYGFPVVILQDHITASSAEIVGGGLQLDGNLVVGWTSFGKGTGQHRFTYFDGAQLWLTSFNWFLQDGRHLTAKASIQPNVVLDAHLSEEAARDAAFRALRDEIATRAVRHTY